MNCSLTIWNSTANEKVKFSKVAGGWTGSTQYHQINEVWEAYKQGADAELLAQWERINK